MAVRWTRQDDGIIAAEAVWDFGLLGSSYEARRLWGLASVNVSTPPSPPLMSLPPVLPNRWAMDRFVPVPVHLLETLPAQPNNVQIVEAAAEFVARQMELGPELEVLYGGFPPTVLFSGEHLVSFLHNVPGGRPALVQRLGDFVLNLGFVFYAAQRGSIN